MSSISDQVHSATLKIMEMLEASPQYRTQLGKATPFALDAIYCAMATFHWVLREGGNGIMRVSLEDMKEFLRELGDRWQLSLEYLTLGELYGRTTADDSFINNQTP